MLREAVTNVLKHTGSRDIHVRLHCAAGRFSMEVEDHSLCAPVSEWKAGNGLRNLRQRAEQIGAILEWQDRYDTQGLRTGTLVRCELPLADLSRPEAGA